MRKKAFTKSKRACERVCKNVNIKVSETGEITSIFYISPNFSNVNNPDVYGEGLKDGALYRLKDDKLGKILKIDKYEYPIECEETEITVPSNNYTNELEVGDIIWLPKTNEYPKGFLAHKILSINSKTDEEIVFTALVNYHW